MVISLLFLILVICVFSFFILDWSFKMLYKRKFLFLREIFLFLNFSIIFLFSTLLFLLQFLLLHYSFHAILLLLYSSLFFRFKLIFFLWISKAEAEIVAWISFFFSNTTFVILWIFLWILISLHPTYFVSIIFTLARKFYFNALRLLLCICII